MGQKKNAMHDAMPKMVLLASVFMASKAMALFDVVFLQMSTVLLLASCMLASISPNEHLNFKQALDIRANIIWNQPFQPWFFLTHKTPAPLNTAAEATAKKRLTDTPYLLAGIILKKSSSKHKVSLLF